MRPAGAFLALTLGVVSPLVAGGGAERGTPAAAQTMNHAAVVVDTGDGVVRKMCLAFPEDEIDGIEALQRVDTRPSRFQTFGSRGAAVCMLCGVGCPSGDCFCDPEKFWAYHRAGPGEDTYAFSSAGAGSTKVRNGDVEAWRWGSGEPPPKTTVSEVCNVPEPPRRTGAATATTTETAPTTTTTERESPAPDTSAPPPATATAMTTPTAPPSAPTDPTTTPPPAPPASETTPDEQTEAADPDVRGADVAAEVQRSLGAEDGAAPAATGDREDPSERPLASLAGFTALLGGLLVWRARLRRAKVRRVRSVR